MANYKNMSELWDYLVDIIEGVPNKYKLGGFGRKDADGKVMYDCVCLIKSFPWCNGVAGAEPTYKGNGINDDWLGYYYANADIKSDKMSELPKEGIWLVYLNNEHIAVYNSATGTTIECCAGATMRVVERDIHHYDGTSIQWNKWSDLYWCPQGKRNTRSTIRKFEETPSDIVQETGEKKYFRVQIGAYGIFENAVRAAKKSISQGHNAIIKRYDDIYRVQVGAYKIRDNAVNKLNAMISLGYDDAYITESGGTDISFK